MTTERDDQDNPQEHPHVRKWEFKPDVSIGNIITLVVMVVGIIVGYTKLEARVESLAQQVRVLASKEESLSLSTQALRDAGHARQEVIAARLARMETLIEQLVRNSGGK